MAEPLHSNSYDPWDYSGYTHAHQENPMFHPTESNGSQQCRPTYTKRQLTQIYDRMAARDQLVVPFDCDIPVTLHREGVMVGYQEFVEDKWVCMGHDGNVMGPMRKAEVLKEKNVESVVPLSWLRRQSVSLAQFAKIWEELEESQKENRRQATLPTVTEEVSSSHDEENLVNTKASVARAPYKRAKFDGLDLLSPEMDTDHFAYLDSNGGVQGPFHKDQLLGWWQQGYLPADLQLRPDTGSKDDLFLFPSLLSKWFAMEESWTYIDSSGAVQGPFPRELIATWFTNEVLPLNLQLRPEEWSETNPLWLELPQVLVFWFPKSDQWCCQGFKTKDALLMSPKDALSSWKTDYNFTPDSLKVKPTTWPGNSFFPVEMLLKAYGYVF